MSDSEAGQRQSAGRRRRGGGRRGHQEAAAAKAASAASSYRPQPRLTFPPMEIATTDQVEAIHEASLTILQEIGIDFLHAEARAILKLSLIHI